MHIYIYIYVHQLQISYTGNEKVQKVAVQAPNRKTHNVAHIACLPCHPMLLYYTIILCSVI